MTATHMLMGPWLFLVTSRRIVLGCLSEEQLSNGDLDLRLLRQYLTINSCCDRSIDNKNSAARSRIHRKHLGIVPDGMIGTSDVMCKLITLRETLTAAFVMCNASLRVTTHQVLRRTQWWSGGCQSHLRREVQWSGPQDLYPFQLLLGFTVALLIRFASVTPFGGHAAGPIAMRRRRPPLAGGLHAQVYRVLLDGRFRRNWSFYFFGSRRTL